VPANVIEGGAVLVRIWCLSAGGAWHIIEAGGSHLPAVDLMSADLIGQTVNGYEILNQVGQGGMATVYLARQQSMNRHAALKFLPSVFMHDDAYLQRFEREVKIVSSLEHRNIVPVYDYGEFDGQPYIAMRFMPAGSAADLLAEGRIPLPRVLSIVEQVASALDYAHQKGILHRDLKPSNILLDDGGGVFITDFGIARILREGGSTITTQGVVGTPSYMSPEQARAEPLDGRSDVYSLGVMLFELVTGRRPFESDTPYSIAVMHVTMPPPSPRQLEPEVSAALEKVILRALRKAADERYESAGALAEDLRLALDDAVAGGEQGKAPEVEPVAAQPSAAFAPLLAASATGDTSPAVPGLIRRPPEPGRRRKNVWRGMMTGGALGCALLAGLLILALPSLGILSRDDGLAATATAVAPIAGLEPATAAEPSAVRTVARPQSDARSDRLRMTQSALNAAADATFTAESILRQSGPTPSPRAIQPVGVRQRPTLIPALQSVDGELVYFARRETGGEAQIRFEIVVLDLRTWEWRRFHAGGGSSAYPMPSPDGRWIAFQSNRDGDFEIYVANIYGGQLRQLTANSVWDRLASWSPEGDWIVYSTDERGDETFDLVQTRPGNGETQPVYSSGWRDSHARYSLDGRYLVFTSGPAVRDANSWEIRLKDRNTGETKLLTDNNVRDASPTFSPDSQRILYVTTVAGARALASMNLEGEDRRLLYTGPGSVWSANYSPDGRFIVVTATVNGLDQLFLMDAAGGNMQQITTAGGAYASWIPRVTDQ